MLSTRARRSYALILGAWLVAGALEAEGSATETSAAEEVEMHQARGEFEVQVLPRELDGPAEDQDLSRLALVKEYRGDLEGAGKGQMLAAGGPAQGAGAYAAIERFTGTLGGRTGSFVLMHQGTMDASGSEISGLVVPGSGSGELEGISGTYRIVLEDGKHRYELDYALPR